MTAANQHDAPQLDHLFASYLNAELANDFGPAFGSEVELYDAGTAWRCEPKAAWDDACAAVRLQPTAPADFKVAAPADWGTTANIAAAVAALPLAAGSFPQLVRDLPSLIGAERLADLRPTGNRPAAPASAAFQTWAFQTAQQHGMPSALLVIGFGALTVYFHDERFIQIKPTIIYAGFALLLLGGWLRGKPLIKYLLQAVFEGLSEEGWLKLSRNWGLFFVAMAAINEGVRAMLDFDSWLTVKVWALPILSILFAMAHVPLMMKHGLGEDAQPET